MLKINDLVWRSMQTDLLGSLVTCWVVQITPMQANPSDTSSGPKCCTNGNKMKSITLQEEQKNIVHITELSSRACYRNNYSKLSCLREYSHDHRPSRLNLVLTARGKNRHESHIELFLVQQQQLTNTYLTFLNNRHVTILYQIFHSTQDAK